MNIIEIIGYAASVLVAISLTMSNIWRLRWINLTGAVFFSVYGLSVGAYPVFAVNAFIVCVNIYYIVQLSQRKDFFSYIELREKQDPMLNKFFDYYKNDIEKYFPEFQKDALKDPFYHIILRNLVPVGLFIYELHPGGVITVELDYVIPDYRDLKNARFIYSKKAEELGRQGYNHFVTKSGMKAHQDYLKKIGYRQDPANPEVFRKDTAGNFSDTVHA